MVHLILLVETKHTCTWLKLQIPLEIIWDNWSAQLHKIYNKGLVLYFISKGCI